MDAVTYPTTEVVEFIEQNVIPLRVAADAKPLSTDFNVKWTPTLVILSADGREHSRTTGFLAPEELIPSVLLGMAKVSFDNDLFTGALSVLDTLLEKYPKSAAAPEGVYIKGVCRYKSTKDPKPLKEAYEQLQAEYPTSDWTKRAYPYRLL